MKRGMKPMRFYTPEEWNQWLLEHSRLRENGTYPSEKQLAMLHRFGVNKWAITQLDRPLGNLVANQIIRENHEYHDQRRQKEASEAARREQQAVAELEARAEAARLERELEARRLPTVDRRTGLVGTPSQVKWAHRIRTSLKPYLQKLAATTRMKDPELSEAFDYALQEKDASFWIGFRSADMGDEELGRMVADVRRRRMLDTVNDKATSGLIGWDEIPAMSKRWKGA